MKKWGLVARLLATILVTFALGSTLRSTQIVQAATSLPDNWLTSLPPEAIPPEWVATHPPFGLAPGGKSNISANAILPPFTSAQMCKAYGIDQLGSTGTGKTIAIIGAYGSATIQADLNTFSNKYDLQQLTLTLYSPSGAYGESDSRAKSISFRHNTDA